MNKEISKEDLKDKFKDIKEFTDLFLSNMIYLGLERENLLG